MIRNRWIALSFLVWVTSFKVYAYPEMVRHGYTNCVACHLSPSGGGSLTSYGRKLNKELLSYKWSGKPKVDEENPEKDKSWHFGGEARLLRFYHDNEYERTSRFIPMQLQGDATYNSEKYAFVGRAGVTGKGGEETGESSFSIGVQLPILYGLARFGEVWNVRAGRFLPGYGLNNSMHFLGTRSDLGFGFDDQRPGVELTRLGESWGFMAGVFSKRGEDVGHDSAMGQIQYSPTDKSKYALNYWHESNLRDLYGLWFVTPIYGPIYLSADLNHQHEISPSANGYAYYSRLGYEIRQGLNAFVMTDNSQRDKNRSYTRIDRYGPGVQFYPLTYLDFELAWLKETNRLYSTKQGDYAYLLVHSYF